MSGGSPQTTRDDRRGMCATGRRAAQRARGRRGVGDAGRPRRWGWETHLML